MINVGDEYFMVRPTASGFTVEKLICESNKEANIANKLNMFCFDKEDVAKSAAESLERTLYSFHSPTF